MIYLVLVHYYHEGYYVKYISENYDKALDVLEETFRGDWQSLLEMPMDERFGYDLTDYTVLEKGR